MSYLGSNDHIPYDSCPEPELTWEEYREQCFEQIVEELPAALTSVLINSTMPMSRWGNISRLMLEAYKYGLDEGRNH